MFLFAASVLMAACGGKGDVAPLAFESYEDTAEGVGPEGGPAQLDLKIDIPIGEGERQEKVSAGIREIISLSEVGQELKQPVEGSLKEIANAFLGYFPIGVAKGELESSGAVSYQLWIENESQTSEAVFFKVSCGIYSNGGPVVSYKAIRMSDGKLMDEKEIHNFSGNDVVPLVKKYGTDEQKAFDDAFIGPDAYLCPVSDSCRILYLEGAHFWNVVTVPINEITGFLTEEGKKLFQISDDSTSGSSQKESVAVEPESPKPAEPGRGELGIFDLRGPVKECKWKTENGTKTYTFDENGFWLTEDGQKLKDVFLGGIERDAQKRIKDGWVDGYGSRHYTYNAQGLATIIEEDGSKQTLTYDADGYVKKEFLEIYPEMGDDEGTTAEQHTFTYTILEKDEIGNWTKRKCSQGTETRTITYY